MKRDREAPDEVRLVIETGAEVSSPRQPTDGGDYGLPERCPVIPLGVYGNLAFYFDATGQIQGYKPTEHSRLGIVNLFGSQNHLLEEFWPRYGREGIITGVDYERASRTLMGAAAARGIWNPQGSVRGSGAWSDADGQLVLHCGDAVLINGEMLPPGVHGRYIYPAGKAIPKPWDKSVPGSAGPAQRLLTLLESWSWKRKERDSRLLLGWIGAAIIGGALDWRPVIWVSGGRGTGKSTLHRTLAEVLGGAVVAVSDASAAGLWQSLGHSSLPVLLDEIEAEVDNRRPQAILKLARQAASGGLVLRGGADHGASEFTARSCFLFSSILVPPLLGQDRSRMAILELGPLPRTPAPVLEPGQLRGLGRQLLRRMVDGWRRWPETLAVYRAALAEQGHDARSADVYGTLLAAADLLLSDGEPHHDFVEELVEQLQIGSLTGADDDIPDEEMCLRHLLTQAIPLDATANKRSIGEWVARAAAVHSLDVDFEEAIRILGRYGLKVHHASGTRWFAVASSHAELGKLFNGTHWAGRSGLVGVWTQALRRLPAAAAPGKNVWFSGATAKATLLPLELALAAPDDEDRPRAAVAPLLRYRDEDA